MICDVPDDTSQGPRRLPGHNLLLGSNDSDFFIGFHICQQMLAVTSQQASFSLVVPYSGTLPSLLGF